MTEQATGEDAASEDATTAAEPTNRSAVHLSKLFSVFLRIGATSLGGGGTGWIHREVVTQLHWLTDEEFAAGVAIAQVLPGVNTTNLTVYLGHRLAGWRGALVALSGLLAGPFVVAVLTAMTYRSLLKVPYFDAGMIGVAAVALGMVLRVSLLTARRCIPGAAQTLVMISAFLSVGVFHWPLIPTLLVLAPLSVYAARPRKEIADA